MTVCKDIRKKHPRIDETRLIKVLKAIERANKTKIDPTKRNIANLAGLDYSIACNDMDKLARFEYIGELCKIR